MLSNCGAGEDSWESLGSKEIKPVKPKGNQPWMFIERTDAKALILWPPDGKSRLIGKDPNVGKDGGQKEKGATEDEMIGWHHWLDGHEFEQLQEIVKEREAWHAAVHGVRQDLATEQQQVRRTGAPWRKVGSYPGTENIQDEARTSHTRK